MTTRVRFTSISYTGSVSVPILAWAHNIEASLLILLVVPFECVPDVVSVTLMKTNHGRFDLCRTNVSRF